MMNGPKLFFTVPSLFSLLHITGKLEMVKSKLGLAISAVTTIFASFAMSVGLCSFFGFTPTVNGGEIFPYLVVIIGLENVIVITKSVVSIPVHLDVKYRIAQGLSREGWGIIKNFLLELFVLFVGYFTTSPAIQEFCLFGFVGLVVDMYLQMFFFCAVLSIDIGRMDLADHLNQKTDASLPDSPTNDQVFLKEFPQVHCPVLPWITKTAPSEPAGTALPKKTSTVPARSVAKFPRRVQILWLLGSKRVMQRALMVFTLAWIGVVIYQSGYILENIRSRSFWINDSLSAKLAGEAAGGEHIQKLSYRHWPTLFEYYNISLSERYISMLPPIMLSVTIPPEQAVASRHPMDHKKTPWKDEAFIEKQQEYLQAKLAEQEVWVLIALGICAAVMLVAFILYALRLLWPFRRQERARRQSSIPFTSDVQVHCLLEHLLSIENLVVNEDLVATSCIGAQLRIWNWNQLELVRAIKRVIPPVIEKYLDKDGNEVEESSPGSHKEYFLILSRQIWCLALCETRVGVGCADGMVELYDAVSGENLACYKGVPHPVASLALNSDRVIVGRETGIVDVLFYNDRILTEIHTSKLHLAAVGRITIVGEKVVTVGYDNVIKVLRVSDWVCLHSMWHPSSSLSSFCLIESSLTACSGYADGHVKLWNLGEGTSIKELAPAREDNVKIVCLNDTAAFALYSANLVAKWDRSSGLLLTTLDMGPGYVGGMVVREMHVFIAGLAEIHVLDTMNLEEMKVISLEANIADYVALPRKLTLLPNNDIICDYGRQIRILRFFSDKKSS